MERNRRKRCDLHCHMLPGIDDGSKSCEETMQMLRASVQQGIDGIVMTPHYYPKETIAHFLERRQRSFDSLLPYLRAAEEPMPELCLGAEAAYHNGLTLDEHLDWLCIGKSRYLLLELPFSKWSPRVLRDVKTLRSERNIVPVIAHLERYLKIQERRVIDELIDSDVLIQMNAEYLLGFWTRGKAKKMLRSGTVRVMGSDSHNMTTRPPVLGDAFDQLEKDGMEQELREVLATGREIFREGMEG